MDDFEKELKIGFLEEAYQALADTEQCFLLLESDANDTENLNKIFRLAHNLKGSSKAVGFERMGAFTHEFETFILKIKNQELTATPDIIGLLLRCNDFLRHMVTTLKQDLDANFEIESWVSELTAASSATLVADQSMSDLMVEIAQQAEQISEPSLPAPSDVILDEPVVIEASVPEAQDSLVPEVQNLFVPEAQDLLVPEAQDLLLVPEAQDLTAELNSSLDGAGTVAPSPKPEVVKQSQKSAPKSSEETLRVAVSKVEDLLNTVGEMVILQSVLSAQIQKLNSQHLQKTSYQLEKVGKEIQDLAMSLRMVPVKPSFQKMQRIVRDTAAVLGKEVGITLVGEDSELDKTVLEKINDPLVHLVRNSVDHGIESTANRLAAGKPAKGEVKLAAFHESGKFIIEVSDDGGGLNPDKLIKKAVEKKLIKPDSKLTDSEAYQLIFLPGFSTKEQVTDVSGRGVGMDVVKTNITDLGGEVEISSQLGKGSTFRISLPLTLAIIESMIVRVENQKFVIPMAHISETLQPKDQIQATQMGDVMMLRGENLPMFRLADFFQIPSQSIAKQMMAMIIRSQGHGFAILVDEILQQSQVVFKQLGPELANYKGVTGSTILSDGKPAFILEPSELFHRKANHHSTARLNLSSITDASRKVISA